MASVHLKEKLISQLFFNLTKCTRNCLMAAIFKIKSCVILNCFTTDKVFFVKNKYAFKAGEGNFLFSHNNTTLENILLYAYLSQKT